MRCQIDKDFQLMFPDKHTNFIEIWNKDLNNRIVSTARSIRGNITVNQLISTVENGPSEESEMRGTLSRCFVREVPIV